MSESFVPYYYKVWKEKKWQKLLYHNFKLGGGFKNEEEAQYSSDPYRYSVLKELTNIIQNYQEFELLLEYPTYHIHWIQSDNPVKLKESDVGTGNVRGFKLLNPPNEKFPEFKGLAVCTSKYSNVVNTFLKGQLGSICFYFAVGMYEYAVGGWGTSAIPGNGTAEQELSLWVKISSNIETYNYKRKDNIILIMLMPFLLITLKHKIANS